MNRVKHKVVVVTGGASGIGEATCRMLVDEGAYVAILDIQDEKGNALVSELNAKGKRAHYWHLDVTDPHAVEKAMKTVHETFGRIDGLVNDAGVGGGLGGSIDYSLENWSQTLAINVTGVFLCTKHALPHMIQGGGGSIVNISSIAGIIGAKSISPGYAASKGAVRLLTKCDAMTYVDKNIRVNSVHPGFTWTPIMDPLEEMGFTRERLAKGIPMGRVAEPKEVAYGILFLISDESSFMTGSELVMDGGVTAQ